MPQNIDPLSMKGEMLLRKFSHLAHGVQNGPPIVRDMIKTDYVHGMKRNLQLTIDDYVRTEQKVHQRVHETERKRTNHIDRVKNQFEREKQKLQQTFAPEPENISTREQQKLNRKLSEIDKKLQREIESVSQKFDQKIETLQQKKAAAQMDLENTVKKAEQAYSEMGTVSKIISGELPPDQIVIESSEQPAAAHNVKGPLAAGKIVLKIR